MLKQHNKLYPMCKDKTIYQENKIFIIIFTHIHIKIIT